MSRGSSSRDNSSISISISSISIYFPFNLSNDNSGAIDIFCRYTDPHFWSWGGGEIKEGGRA